MKSLLTITMTVLLWACQLPVGQEVSLLESPNEPVLKPNARLIESDPLFMYMEAIAPNSDAVVSPDQKLVRMHFRGTLTDAQKPKQGEVISGPSLGGYIARVLESNPSQEQDPSTEQTSWDVTLEKASLSQLIDLRSLNLKLQYKPMQSERAEGYVSNGYGSKQDHHHCMDSSPCVLADEQFINKDSEGCALTGDGMLYLIPQVTSALEAELSMDGKTNHLHMHTQGQVQAGIRFETEGPLAGYCRINYGSQNNEALFPQAQFSAAPMLLKEFLLFDTLPIRMMLKLNIEGEFEVDSEADAMVLETGVRYRLNAMGQHQNRWRGDIKEQSTGVEYSDVHGALATKLSGDFQVNMGVQTVIGWEQGWMKDVVQTELWFKADLQPYLQREAQSCSYRVENVWASEMGMTHDIVGLDWSHPKGTPARGEYKSDVMIREHDTRDCNEASCERMRGTLCKDDVSGALFCASRGEGRYKNCFTAKGDLGVMRCECTSDFCEACEVTEALNSGL